nr:alpha/beta hydrolase-fold protein [uncultured Carboxylicivirga sp.]
MKHLSVILLFFLTTNLKSQDICLGSKHHIYSNILKEDREYWVALPDSYYDTTLVEVDYPVLYLLDGDRNYMAALAVQNDLSRGLYNYIPEMIIVGVLNTDRSRDLTPSKSQVMYKGKALHTSSGGAENFYSFITGELRKEINRNYPTNGYSIIEGHSFGGLFVINTLLNHSQSFNAYIAHDPSLWWDDCYTLRKAADKWNQLSLQGKRLFVSQAVEELTDTFLLPHVKAIKKFNQLYLNDKSNGLTGKVQQFTQDDHGTIFLPASYRAHQFVFEGYCVPVKKVPNHPELVNTYYKQLSDKLCFTFHPKELWLINLSKYCLSVDQPESAVQLINNNLKQYPQSGQSMLFLGDVLSDLNQKQEALHWYNQALLTGKVNSQLITDRINKLQINQNK